MSLESWVLGLGSWVLSLRVFGSSVLRGPSLRARRDHACAETGGGLASASAGRRFRAPGRRRKRGLPPEFFRAAPADRAKRLGHARRCPLRVGLPRSQTPTRLGANGRLGGWDKYGCTSFLRYFGLVGPSRPRRDPRPARSPGAGLDANITSRCKRSFSSSTRPVACGAAPRGALRQAARSIAEVQAALRKARASSITRRSAGGLVGGSRQARFPARAMAAGLVAASMARRGQSTSKNSCSRICPNRQGAC